jgi:Sulfotransferase domain
MPSSDQTSASVPGAGPAGVPVDKTRSTFGDEDPLAHPLRPFTVRGAARLGARNGLMMANRPTVRARLLPTFLIAGAARCGTTTMYATLSQHPAIAPSLLRTKEVHFFDNRYDRGLAWYQCHFPLRARVARAAHAAGAREPHAFESGVSYMFHPLAPERIKRDLPGVKLLVLLRDPVERAFSSHANSVSKNCELEPFERAIELESTRLSGERERILADPSYASLSYRQHAYRTRGEYIDQIERLEALFGRESIHVVDSAAFFADPAPWYDGVLDFLGVPNAGYPVFKHLNARARPAPMSDSVRKSLMEHYRPYDERLAKWLGWEPTWCRKHS